MTMDELPPAVRDWIALTGKRGVEVDAARRALLADDATLSFAGQETEGADAIVAQQARMGGPDMPTPDWSVMSGATATQVTMHGRFGGDGRAGPNGLSALDLTFTLGNDGRIQRLAPLPHHPEPNDLQPALAIGALAPAFMLPDTDKTSVSLHEQGTVTLVVWTCNHCPWALAWHDRLQQVARDYAGRVRMVQVNANDPAVSPHDRAERSRERVEAGEFASAYLIDAGQRAARAWGARHTPDAFVLDGEGRIIYHGAPDADHRDPALNARWLRDALDAALAGRNADPAVTKPVGCTIKWTLARPAAAAADKATLPESATGGSGRIELLYWADCPSHSQALDLLRRVMPDYGVDPHSVVLREVMSQDDAVVQGFIGSPTIRIDGADIVSTEGEAPALTCRVYRHRNGRYDPLPEEQDLREALRRFACAA